MGRGQADQAYCFDDVQRVGLNIGEDTSARRARLERFFAKLPWPAEMAIEQWEALVASDDVRELMQEPGLEETAGEIAAELASHLFEDESPDAPSVRRGLFHSLRRSLAFTAGKDSSSLLIVVFPEGGDAARLHLRGNSFSNKVLCGLAIPGEARRQAHLGILRAADASAVCKRCTSEAQANGDSALKLAVSALPDHAPPPTSDDLGLRRARSRCVEELRRFYLEEEALSDLRLSLSAAAVRGYAVTEAENLLDPARVALTLATPPPVSATQLRQRGVVDTFALVAEERVLLNRLHAAWKLAGDPASGSRPTIGAVASLLADASQSGRATNPAQARVAFLCRYFASYAPAVGREFVKQSRGKTDQATGFALGQLRKHHPELFGV